MKFLELRTDSLDRLFIPIDKIEKLEDKRTADGGLDFFVNGKQVREIRGSDWHSIKGLLDIVCEIEALDDKS